MFCHQFITHFEKNMHFWHHWWVIPHGNPAGTSNQIYRKILSKGYAPLSSLELNHLAIFSIGVSSTRWCDLNIYHCKMKATVYAMSNEMQITWFVTRKTQHNLAITKQINSHSIDSVWNYLVALNTTLAAWFRDKKKTQMKYNAGLFETTLLWAFYRWVIFT